jgi:ribonuclease E
LVEHYVARRSQTSLIGNVYLGRVQNVLPSMEAAFVDIGKGRNAVLYAGEVNWDLLGKGGQPRKIESALKSGQQVLVQVSKDPVGHKGARLTSQISLPGRFLVYVPSGQSSGISRKLPDTERNRLKALLKQILPGEAGVIIRTAAEGASETELTRDVNRLTAQWEDITKKVEGGQAPQLLYGEPDLTVKVVRDLFTEDFASLMVDGDEAWDVVNTYVDHVAPELAERVRRWEADRDAFSAYRIDEQIAKGLDRKVYLPSGGSLVIDRTEAMTVVDVNTGKFTGSGGNLEQTVTKNNLEAAEELVRQLRLRDIGGIIVVDFIDMVLESNRELVLRRLIECLGRDRTKHQVAEVTSLGLVQMTRKRIGTGLLEAFSEPCPHCEGRGLLVSAEPVEPKADRAEPSRSRRGGRDQAKAIASAPKMPTPPVPTEPTSQPVASEPSDAPAPDDQPATTDGPVEATDPSGAPEPTGTPPGPNGEPSSGPTTRPSLLPRSSAPVDDLPPAVTPRKRTRKRVTKPA